MPLAILTCHFNPVGYRQPRRNFLRFVRQLHSLGLPIYVAELAFGDWDWVLPEAPNVLRIRTDEEQQMWYKENLLNLLERIVPRNFDRLAWVDADVWFERSDWYEATEKALEAHAVVQMFDRVIRTNEDGTVGSSQVSAAKAGSIGLGEHHPGMAWAARRTLWTEAGGLYEEAVIGGGDTVNAAAWMADGLQLKWIGYPDFPEGILRLRRWASGQGPCGCVAGTIWHEWHGDDRNRCYELRHEWRRLLDVRCHLRKRHDDLLQWTDEAPQKLLSLVRAYFLVRREDGERPEIVVGIDAE